MRKVLGRDEQAGDVTYRDSGSGVKGILRPVRTTTDEKRISLEFTWGDVEDDDGFFVNDAEREHVELALRLATFAERQASKASESEELDEQPTQSNGSRPTP